MKKIIAISVCGLMAAPVFSGERMTSEEMRAFYSGKTLTTHHFKTGPGKAFFDADGSVRSLSDDGKERIGKWWIDEARNMRCVRWNSRNKDLCRYTERNADGTHSLVRPDDGRRLIEFTSSADGNQL